jgi:hypothetical protein
MPERIFMKLGMYIMASEPISNGVLYISLPPACLSVYVSPIVARQRLGTNFIAARNTHATIEELLDVSLSMGQKGKAIPVTGRGGP